MREYSSIMIIAILVGLLLWRATTSHVPISRDKIPPVKRYTETITFSQVDFKMVYVPGDSDKGVKSLYVGEYEVTWNEFLPIILGEHLTEIQRDKALGLATISPSFPCGSLGHWGFGFEGIPALGMSYRGATAYLHQLRKLTGIQYRLPSEKEWQYIYTSGGGHLSEPMTKEEADRMAVYVDTWDEDYDSEENFSPRKVGSKNPNKLGIYDMAGNVAEWVHSNGKQHFVLGGHFTSKLKDLGHSILIKDRTWNKDNIWNEYYPNEPQPLWWYTDAPWTGFRVVCDIENGKPKKWRSENTAKEIKEIQSIR